MVANWLWTGQKLSSYFPDFEQAILCWLWASQKVGSYFADFG